MICKHGEQDWIGGAPKCAFDEDGNFTEDNWNCFLMGQVRWLCSQWNEKRWGNYWWDEDSYTGVIYVPFGYIGKKCVIDNPLRGAIVVLDWYKSRGATDDFRIVEGDSIRKGTEMDAVMLVELFSEFIEKGDKDE